MLKAPLYNQKGEKTGEISLNSAIFEIPFNRDLVHQALVRQLSMGRLVLAHAKTKGEVRGGGRKPWRQKGTGRARQGSIRSPLWKGGGVTFGPRNTRNFKKDMPKKQRRKALFVTLSEKARENKILALDKYETDKPKTKEFVAMIKKLPIEKDVLVVIAEKSDMLQKSARNLKIVKTISAGYLNIKDLIKYDKVLFLKSALDKLEKTFL